MSIVDLVKQHLPSEEPADPDQSLFSLGKKGAAGG